MVERQLPKLNVAGSIPVSRSNPVRCLLVTWLRTSPASLCSRSVSSPSVLWIRDDDAPQLGLAPSRKFSGHCCTGPGRVSIHRARRTGKPSQLSWNGHWREGKCSHRRDARKGRNGSDSGWRLQFRLHHQAHAAGAAPDVRRRRDAAVYRQRRCHPAGPSTGRGART